MAESAEVTKKVKTKVIARTERTLPRGYSLKEAKRISSVAKRIKLTPESCSEVDKVPKAENQIKLRTVGAKSTTVKNSRIVRPFEIRAIKTPTKGDQEIHHAQ